MEPIDIPIGYVSQQFHNNFTELISFDHFKPEKIAEGVLADTEAKSRRPIQYQESKQVYTYQMTG